MKNDINSSNFKILSKKEESKLSKEEQIKYYKKLWEELSLFRVKL